MTKICSQCNVERDISFYYKTKRKSGTYYQPMCKLCNKERYNKGRYEYTKRIREEKGPIYRKQVNNSLAKRYGISADEFNRRMSIAETCEICGIKPNKQLSYDHDHETGKFRGLLCNKCNMALGQLGDNVDGLKKAIKYLERNMDEYN